MYVCIYNYKYTQVSVSYVYIQLLTSRWPFSYTGWKIKNAFVWLDKNRARKWEGLDGQLIQAVDFTTLAVHSNKRKESN